MIDSTDEIIGLLAEAVAAAPAPDLAGAVVRAAMSARAGGQAISSLGGGHRADPAEAFIQTVHEFNSVLATVSNSALVVEPYEWSVTQLVAHLLEVELYFGRQLGLWRHEVDEVHEDDHLKMTESAVHAAAGADFAATVARWHDVSASVCAHLASLDADQLRQRVKFHTLETRLSTVLVVRVFEVWTHTEDLCRTLGCPPPSLDAARLHLMTSVAVPAIPIGMLLANIDGGGHTARVVLTGRGGGVWNQPLQMHADAGEPTVTIVADSLEFCRLAAQRITPHDLRAEIEGPVDLAVNVLRGASVFAA